MAGEVRMGDGSEQVLGLGGTGCGGFGSGQFAMSVAAESNSKARLITLPSRPVGSRSISARPPAVSPIACSSAGRRKFTRSMSATATRLENPKRSAGDRA